MPKDYQEELLKPFEWLKDYPALPDPECSHSVYDDIKRALTTYGNARELQGVEKVKKGVPEEIRTGTFTKEWEGGGHITEDGSIGFSLCRQATLDHIERIKKESGFRPVGSPEEVPVGSITNKVN